MPLSELLQTVLVVDTVQWFQLYISVNDDIYLLRPLSNLIEVGDYVPRLRSCLLCGVRTLLMTDICRVASMMTGYSVVILVEVTDRLRVIKGYTVSSMMVMTSLAVKLDLVGREHYSVVRFLRLLKLLNFHET